MFLRAHIREKLQIKKYAAYCYEQALSEVPCLYEAGSLEQKMCEVSYLSINYFMPVLLNRKDRMSMAWGLEIRVPFSDHRLVEYVWKIPPDIKFFGGLPKGILRKAMEEFLPSEVIYRAKSPYPKTHNPQYEFKVRQSFRKILGNREEPLFMLFDIKRLTDYIDKNGRIFPVPWFGQLMGDVQYLAYLIQLNQWIKRYNINLLL